MIVSDSTDALDALETSVADLVAEFGEWAADRDIESDADGGTDVDLFVVEVALDWLAEGDGDVTRWAVADIEKVLLEWFPRKVTLTRPEWPSVLSTLRLFVDFLAEERMGEPADAAALRAAIDRVAPEFLARMADEQNYGMAKFWTTRMTEHGVDLDDDEDVQRFLASVHRGEIDFDQDVLAEIMRRGSGNSAPDEPPPLPPVLLPTDGELALLAQDTPLVVRFRSLVAWLGTGRALTATKRLRLADARELALLLEVDQPFLERARSSADLPEVSLLVAWARATRVVRVVKGRLVPVKSAAGLLNRPLDLWWRACESFVELGPAACPPTSHFEGPSLLAYFLRDVALELWLCLYTASGTPVPVELVAQSVRDAVSVPLDFAGGGLILDLQEITWRRDLTSVLRAFVTLGAVELTVATDEWERAELVRLSGEEDPDLTLVRPTPLGLWGARTVLVAEGIDAPSVPDLAGRPLAEVCEVLRHPAPEVVEAVMAEWVGSRADVDAAAELAAYCEDGPSPAARLLAWAGLEHTGAPGVAQARRLRAGGGVAGAMATGWLVRHGELAEKAATEHEMVLVLAENLAAVHDDELLIEELTKYPVRDQVGFVRGIAGADHPDRVEMLATIADSHPEPKVAAAARRALAVPGRVTKA